MGFRLSLLREATEFSLTSKGFCLKFRRKLSGASAGGLHLLRIGNSCEQGTPLAASQTARGAELLRLAVPARRYLPGHMDDVAKAVQYTYARR